MTFEDRLGKILAETIGIGSKLDKLYGLISKVAVDFRTQFVPGEIEQFEEDNLGNAGSTVVDAEGTILWLTLNFELSSGKITEYTIIAGPSQDQQWDFPDMPFQTPYQEFLEWTTEVPVEPPAKDYGIDFLNIVAWVIHAHQQIAANPTDPGDSFEAGHYRVEFTVKHPDGMTQTARQWIEASSAQDAIDQAVEQLGRNLVGQPRVVQFARERSEWES